MPWYRTDDNEYDDPLMVAIGDKAYAALHRLRGYTSKHRKNGWLPEAAAKALASTAVLATLTRTRLGEDPPLLHAYGDECRCLAQHHWTEAMGGFWLHGFLDRNPSRAENDVHKAKLAELKDKELRHFVKQRDGDQCRYCGVTVNWADRRSGRGGVLDHVDPTIADGAANLVVCCRSCNGRKKDNTVAAAGMELLPVPSGQTNAPIYAEPTPNQRQINDRPAEHQQQPNPDPALDPEPGSEPVTAPAAGPSPHHRPSATATTGSIHAAMTDGVGRAGQGRDRAAGAQGMRASPTAVGPAFTPRGPLSRNPYLKSWTNTPHPTPEGEPP